MQVAAKGKEKQGEIEEVVGGNEARLAWVWVQGWRSRLRCAGDLVERCRFELDFD